MLTTPMVTFETDPGRGVLWRAWQGPRAWCSLRGDTRGGVQRRMRRGPRVLWCHGGDCEAVCEWPGSDVVHSVGRCVLLQRHRGEGSCMAVAFLVWWCPLPSFSVSFGSRLRFRRLHECGMWVDAAVVLVLYGLRRCPNPTTLSCFYFFLFFSFPSYDLLGT